MDPRTIAFAKSLLPDAKAAESQFRIPAAFIVAQAVHESTNLDRPSGISQLAEQYHNLFGITASDAYKAQGRPFVNLPTHEEITGQLVPEERDFRTYQNDLACIVNYCQIVQENACYADAVRAAAAGDAAAYFQGIAAGGWATDSNYAAECIATYEDLQAVLGQGA